MGQGGKANSLIWCAPSQGEEWEGEEWEGGGVWGEGNATLEALHSHLSLKVSNGL